MHVTVPDERPTAKQRQLEDLAAGSQQSHVMTNGETPLSKSLDEFEQRWLLEHVVSQWQALHSGLSTWRNKLSHYEKLSDDDYSDRASANNPESTDAKVSIFARENHTLGIVSGMCDSVYSRAKSDIFGVRPWLAATPQGKDDIDLASLVSKHSQWKFDQSNLEDTLIDSLNLSPHLGTTFLKVRWLKDVDKHERLADVAWSKSGKAAILTEGGDYIGRVEDLPEGTDGEDVEWQQMLIEDTTEITNNIEAACLDYKVVAFDEKAPELDLRFTPFFHQFPARVLDLVAEYGLSEEQKQTLLGLAETNQSEEARAHRGETDTLAGDSTMLDAQANPEVQLVEGFIRCDPTLSKSPIRIHVIFSPTLHVLFQCDYLANKSPGALLPVFPVRCYKVPRRIIGRGYWERYEKENDAIDRQFCATTFRNRHSADVIKAFKRSALENESEGENLTNHPEKIFELKEDKTIDDLISFKVVPDTNQRAMDLMQAMAQFLQMRTGLTSAAQGEIKGLPSSNTATGVQTLMTMGALLVKTQISQMSGDIERAVEYSVHLNLANLDRDETFTWGEGQDAQLYTLKAGDVKGLRANVTLTLTQAQNMEKLENAKAAIGIGAQYVGLMEHEKPSQRRLYIQALESLGYNDADRIIREAAVDPMSLKALLPPDLQPAFDAFLASQGIVPLASPGGEASETDAPVTGQAQA